MNSLKDKNIVIIGAGGGFGKAIIARLAKHGASLALGDISTDAIEAPEGASSVFTQAVDVTDETSVSAFFKAAGDAFTNLDVLLYLPGLSVASPVTDMDLADYDKIMDVNLKGLFLSSKHYLPLTDPERNPMLSFISSQAATRANPNAPVYCAAKAAVSMFGQGLALQAMQQNVRVTAFKPGPVNTQGFWGDRPVPREKFMQADDVAEVIEFVLSLPSHVVMHEVSFESFNFFKK